MGLITERIDRITHIPPEYRAPVVPVPRSVKIELTARCNFACDYCARSDRLRPQQDMDRALYCRLVREMAAAGVEELGVFYLGESFMCPWLPEAIAYAKQSGFRYVFLTTNGSLATRDRVHACMEAGLDSLKFSLNYADAEQLHRIAHVKRSIFDRICDNIKGAWEVRQEGGYRCGLYASYIRYDGEQGERMQAVIDRVRPYLDEIYTLPLYSQAALAEDKEQRQGWRPLTGNTGRAEAPVPPIPCWAVFTEGHITWDGKLSACCFDHAEMFTMGDLTKERFVEAWNSTRYQALRAAHLRGDVRGTPCERCAMG